jgi:hypothetical protein
MRREVPGKRGYGRCSHHEVTLRILIVVHRESETDPRNATQPLTPYHPHLWIEMSLRIFSVASPLVSLFFYSALVVAQIVAPTCNSSAEWEWVCIL